MGEPFTAASMVLLITHWRFAASHPVFRHPKITALHWTTGWPLALPAPFPFYPFPLPLAVPSGPPDPPLIPFLPLHRQPAVAVTHRDQLPPPEWALHAPLPLDISPTFLVPPEPITLDDEHLAALLCEGGSRVERRRDDLVRQGESPVLQGAASQRWRRRGLLWIVSDDWHGAVGVCWESQGDSGEHKWGG